jgi:GBP family porin
MGYQYRGVSPASAWAVATALAVTALPAHSADVELGKTNITFYGVADVAVSVSDSGYGKKTRIDGGGGYSPTRLGLKVDRELGQGLKALVLLEAGVHFDTGSVGAPAPSQGINVTNFSSGASTGTGPALFSRQAYVGLGSDFGRITFGRQFAVSYLVAGGVGSARPDGFFAGTASLTPLVGGMPVRMNNAIVYVSPKVAGVHGILTLTTGSENNINTPVVVANTTTDNSAGRGTEAALYYSRGKLNTAASAWRANANGWVTGETGLARKTGYQLAANYDFGPFKVFGDYVHGTISGGNYENVTKTLSEADAWGLSIWIPVGKHSFMATYTTLNDKSLLNKDTKLFGLGYRYELYKDTLLYATAGKMKNGANSTYSLTDAGDVVGNVSTPGFHPIGVIAGVNIAF